MAHLAPNGFRALLQKLLTKNSVKPKNMSYATNCEVSSVMIVNSVKVLLSLLKY